jgi:hypothetical protein
MMTTLSEVVAAGADNEFYQRFVEAKSKTNGFLYEVSLIDTNNSGPNLTNVAVPFAKFAQEGELVGIKLGMTMSEVVAAWGKPRSLFTHCVFGPRFWYCTGGKSIFGVQGGISLSFRDDRLVLIAVYGDLAQRLTFYNGLTGRMSRAECEKLLGPPDVLGPERRGSLYVGEIAYRAGLIRTDLRFNTWQQRGSVRAPERLDAITVRLEQEARRELTGRLPEAQDFVQEELLPVWLAPGTPVWDRAAAVNRTFTNGTPIPVIIAVLGTNFSQWSSPISTVSLGEGRESHGKSRLEYHFDKGRVIIHTTADGMADPLAGGFTGAGYLVDGLWIGQREGAPDWKEPFRLETNRTSAPTGSQR